MLNEVEDSEEFRRKVNELYTHPDRPSIDIIRFKDGKICQRNTQPQIIGQNIVGRVWSFREVTTEYKANEELKKHTQELEQMNQMTVDRELYMVEQKKKIAELEAKLNNAIIAPTRDN